MNKFENTDISTLTGISKYSYIIAIVLIIVALFTMPTGILLLLVVAALIFNGRYFSKLADEKQRQIVETEVSQPQRKINYTPHTQPAKPTTVPKSISHYYDKDSPYYGSDLIESSDTPFVCEECAKYTKRWFSEYGKNPKYPKLPEYFKQHLDAHKDCAIRFFPVLDNISVPAWDYTGNFVEFCNRPFIDERTPKEKAVFNNHILEKERKQIIKEEYEWLCKQLPEIAPKSIGGYTRMKNTQSENYKKIQQIAAEHGKTLD